MIRSLWKKGVLSRAYYTETRPYNQGSRLTGYELIHDGIPATLITDSMAAALFRLKGKSEKIAAVVVGADRVAANGDTANKIGTYGLAVLARHHGIKFLVVAPRTTIDLATKSGEDIEIEQRPPQEVLSVRGPRNLGLVNDVQSVDTENVESVSTAAIGTQTWNPSFDVTPADLIDAIVTEVSVVQKNAEGRFDLKSLFSKQEVTAEFEEGQKEMPDPAEGP